MAVVSGGTDFGVTGGCGFRLTLVDGEPLWCVSDSVSSDSDMTAFVSVSRVMSLSLPLLLGFCQSLSL